MTAYVTAAAVFGPSGFAASGLGPPGLVADELLASSLTLRGLRPLSRTARLAMVAAAAVWPPDSSPDARDAVVLGSARSSVAPLAEFVQPVVEAVALLSAGRADRALALGADAAEPTVRSGERDAAEGSAAVRLSTVRDTTCLAEVTGCWTAATYDDLSPDVRPADPALSGPFRRGLRCRSRCGRGALGGR